MMTDAEYEARLARLRADAESARVALNNARSYYEGLCNEIRDLGIARREELAAAGSPEDGTP